MITGISIHIQFHHAPQEHECSGGIDPRSHQPITCNTPEMTISQKEKLKSVINEIFVPMTESANTKEAIGSDNTQIGFNAKPDKKRYIAYLSNPPIGTKRKIISENEFESDYLQQIDDYDVFVYHRSVIKKVKKRSFGGWEDRTPNIELDENTFRLLVLFLKYKDINLPYWEIYNKAWQGSAYHAADAESNHACMMNSLKNAVSKLRGIFEDVKEFKIPHARGGGYTCQGDFKFCVIQNESNDNLFTLDKI